MKPDTLNEWILLLLFFFIVLVSLKALSLQSEIDILHKRIIDITERQLTLVENDNKLLDLIRE